ncbi:MAG: hypothetical protein M3322_06365 [Actinomycetota bacterium]|nr:hypothetical protein [Actinomycetota bacterium]
MSLVRMRLVVLLAAAAALLTPTAAFAIGAQRPSGNASCVGFLANASNPNAGFVLHNLVKPALAEQGLTLGEFQRDVAQQHPGVGGFEGLELCIPEF